MGMLNTIVEPRERVLSEKILRSGVVQLVLDGGRYWTLLLT
jgi:hypothetical protein